MRLIVLRNNAFRHFAVVHRKLALETEYFVQNRLYVFNMQIIIHLTV